MLSTCSRRSTASLYSSKNLSSGSLLGTTPFATSSRIPGRSSLGRTWSNPAYHLKRARQTVAANLDKSGQHSKLEGGTPFPHQSLIGPGGDYVASVDSQGARSKSSQCEHRRNDSRPQRKPVPEVPRDRYGMHTPILAGRSPRLSVAGQGTPLKQRTGAAINAATTAPARARWNCPQTIDLRQRPLATIMRRVHTEEVTRPH